MLYSNPIYVEKALAGVHSSTTLSTYTASGGITAVRYLAASGGKGGYKPATDGIHFFVFAN